MVYNLINTPCTRLNNTVGDGTTTAIVFTSHLFDQYNRRKNSLETLYRLPRTFNQTWDECIQALIEDVQTRAKGIDAFDYDTIYNICYVVSNGNHEVSDAIASIYKENGSPVIRQKDSPTNKSYIEPIRGYETTANLIDDAYVKNEDLSVEEKNPFVMLFDHKIESDFCEKIIFSINEVLKAQNRKLIIFAPYYDALLCNTRLRQLLAYEYQQQGKINLICTQYNIGKMGEHGLLDLAAIMGCTIINQPLATQIMNDFDKTSSDRFVEEVLENPSFGYHGIIGAIDSAIMSCANGTLIQPKDIDSNETYQDILRGAKKHLEQLIATTSNERSSYSAKLYDARERVARLEMNNFIYYVGANSALQKKILWDSVEDVIKCVRSAIQHGVVPGCQLSIISACREHINAITEGENKILSDKERLEAMIYSIIQDAWIDTYIDILNGPDGMGMIKTVDMWYSVKAEYVDDLKQRVVDKLKGVVKESIERETVFDLERLEYNPDIITSAETDQMVLVAGSELIKILISGNQCIFLDADINESHNETQQVYV